MAEEEAGLIGNNNNGENRDELYKNRPSRKTDFQQEKRSLGSCILLEIVSENRFSGKTYFYTIASRTRAVKSGQRLCSKFDGSERFVVECPLSTLCKTRMFHLHTHTGWLHSRLISHFMLLNTINRHFLGPNSNRPF